MVMRALKSTLTLLLATIMLASCGKSSSFEDSSGESTVSESSYNETSIVNDTSENKTLEKDGYTMIKTEISDTSYRLDLKFAAKEYNENGQPFQNIFDNSDKSITISNSFASRAAEIAYTKREGGTYIYSNNPEMLAAEDLGKAILRTKSLSGDCMFTFEHSNRTGVPAWLGYQLLNEGDTDATVTVTNIGLQVDGEWLGQRSWSDYFNYRFELPEDYFNKNGTVNPIYVGCDYVDYTPRIQQPVTVTIPAGEYIYVLGGTSADAYNKTNIAGTANKTVFHGKCSNGAVKFKVEGGSVTGTFYIYNDAAQVAANPPEQGYITTRISQATGEEVDYSKQYKGVDYTAGLIEANLTFVVDDKTKAGSLPVTYKKERDPAYASKNTPYAEYSMTETVIKDTKWVTSLNPNNVPEAIGTDMMVFNCIDTEGNPLLIDNNKADASGSPANIGNWMVQYTDNVTLVNSGSEARTFKVFKRGNNGVLFTMVRDEDGSIINAKALTGPYSFGSEAEIFAGVDRSLLIKKNGRLYFKIADGRPYCDVVDERSEVYEITVEPMSVARFSVDYVILGNSNGGITHWIEVE